MLTKLCRQERIRDSACKKKNNGEFPSQVRSRGAKKGMFTYKNTGN